MANELMIPEMALLEKINEVDKNLPKVVFEQMKNELAAINASEIKLPAQIKIKRKMLLSDFVNKAISQKLEISDEIDDMVKAELYRLYLFCCQQTVHNPEVRRNPFVLGFRALEEMHLALVGILISYRLLHPDCPYSWDDKFFENHIVTHKGADGHPIIIFIRPIDAKMVNQAINEEIVTDWLIYRAYDHNGIRTLMDVKNNLLTLPDYKRGGKPSAEFSRFERKMQEKRNQKKEKQDDALELEFRKTMVRSAAEQTVKQMLDSGMSAMDLLNKAFNGDLTKLTQALNNVTDNENDELKSPNKKNKLSNKPKKQIKKHNHIDEVIAGYLGDN